MTANKDFKKPSVTADVIVEQENQILLIERKRSPYKGMWALPGGFLDVDKETVIQAAQRELYEETGLKTELRDLSLVCESSNPKRDERGHIVSLVYATQHYEGQLKAGDDAAKARWHPLNNLPPLAFDHLDLINNYLDWRMSRK